LGVALPGVSTWRLLLRRLHTDEDRRQAAPGCTRAVVFEVR
jgi:hypothetical protein